MRSFSPDRTSLQTLKSLKTSCTSRILPWHFILYSQKRKSRLVPFRVQWVLLWVWTQVQINDIPHMELICKITKSTHSITYLWYGSLIFLPWSHSFGYDCGRRANLQVLDDRTLSLIAGNLLVLLDVPTKQQRYLRSCSGGGIGSVAVKLHYMSF